MKNTDVILSVKLALLEDIGTVIVEAVDKEHYDIALSYAKFEHEGLTEVRELLEISNSVLLKKELIPIVDKRLSNTKKGIAILEISAENTHSDEDIKEHYEDFVQHLEQENLLKMLEIAKKINQEQIIDEVTSLLNKRKRNWQA